MDEVLGDDAGVAEDVGTVEGVGEALGIVVDDAEDVGVAGGFGDALGIDADAAGDVGVAEGFGNASETPSGIDEDVVEAFGGDLLGIGATAEDFGAFTVAVAHSAAASVDEVGVTVDSDVLCPAWVSVVFSDVEVPGVLGVGGLSRDDS